MGLSTASIVRGDLPPEVWRVEFWIGIGAVPVAGSTRAEHHAAAFDGALVHLAKVDGREVNFQGALITKRLEADIALNSFLAGCWIDELGAQIWRQRTPLAFVRRLGFLEVRARWKASGKPTDMAGNALAGKVLCG